MTLVRQTWSVVTEFEPGYGERVSPEDMEYALERLDPNDDDSGVGVEVREVEVRPLPAAIEAADALVEALEQPSIGIPDARALEAAVDRYKAARGA